MLQFIEQATIIQLSNNSSKFLKLVRDLQDIVNAFILNLMGFNKHPFQGKSTYFNTVLYDLVLPKHFREQKMFFCTDRRSKLYRKKASIPWPIQTGTENTEKSAR